ncbi:MAG: putative rane protein [Candidatus Sulfotelmatobacter sp.]|nr:putative rane protein [Candidatus Sulfotelmatobacter sp.]
MAKYLSNLPRPLLDDLIDTRCIPFIGAGLSRNADIPAGAKIPDWDGLGRALAADVSAYEYLGALDAISAYSHEYGRTRLVEELRRLLLVDEAQPSEAHKAFCRIPFEIVFTTNFDFLLERGYGFVRWSCTPITGEDQLTIGPKGSSVRIVKLHGDLHHPEKLVVVEQDYDVTLQKYPLMATFLANMLIYNTALFIGYSLDDPDFRQVWQTVGDRLGKMRRPAYCIAVEASQQSLARYERRGVKLINLPGKAKDYKRILADLFSEIDEHISKGIVDASTSLKEESLEELSLPKGTTGRLCLFLLPHGLQSVYRSVVFPIAEKAGFTPMTVDEIVSPGGSVVAKVAALIDRADLVVIDASSPWTVTELGLIISRQKASNVVLVISEQHGQLPDDLVNLRRLVRPGADRMPDEEFVEEVQRWFAQAAELLPSNPMEEARRLLRKREYRAAVIASSVAMEDELRKIFSQSGKGDPQRIRTLRDLTNAAAQHGVLDKEQVFELWHVMELRNRLVHTTQRVPESEAKLAIRRIEKLLPQIRGLLLN